MQNLWDINSNQLLAVWQLQEQILDAVVWKSYIECIIPAKVCIIESTAITSYGLQQFVWWFRRSLLYSGYSTIECSNHHSGIHVWWSRWSWNSWGILCDVNGLWSYSASLSLLQLAGWRLIILLLFHTVFVITSFSNSRSPLHYKWWRVYGIVE